jgi:NAD(P)-dependent dehydrogenase (short-subunit alcohol dehydrogenase family)
VPLILGGRVTEDMLEEFSLEGNVAIIASGGYSWTKELALSLNQAGARVTVATNDREKINEITAALPEQDVLCIPTDLTSAPEVESMVKRTVSRFGRVDALVNNLNLEFWKSLLDMTEKEWHEVIQTNLTSAFLCSKAVGKYMVAQKAGSIINIVSGLAERGVPNGTAYCASMAAVLELTRALALEWAQLNIRVNAVGIGWADKQVTKDEKDIVARYIPMQRRARAEDVTPLVEFLASKASSFMSGSLYIVDGGLMARA